LPVVKNIKTRFSARQHIAYMLSLLSIIARTSVCPFVRHTVDLSETVEVRIMKFSPLHPASFCGVSFIQKF